MVPVLASEVTETSMVIVPAEMSAADEALVGEHDAAGPREDQPVLAVDVQAEPRR